MFRKLAFAIVAATSLGMTALAPSAASAHDWDRGGWDRGGWDRGRWDRGGHHDEHDGWRHGYGRRFYAGPGYGGGGCWVRRPVPTPWGMRWRLVNRCD